MMQPHELAALPSHGWETNYHVIILLNAISNVEYTLRANTKITISINFLKMYLTLTFRSINKCLTDWVVRDCLWTESEWLWPRSIQREDKNSVNVGFYKPLLIFIMAAVAVEHTAKVLLTFVFLRAVDWAMFSRCRPGVLCGLPQSAVSLNRCRDVAMLTWCYHCSAAPWSVSLWREGVECWGT